MEPRIKVYNEVLIEVAPDHLLCGRTAVIIARRLSTIRNADLICVVQDGLYLELYEGQFLSNPL